MLPAADELRRLQAAALDADYERGGAVPYAVLLIGIAAVAAIVDAGLRERRRTNRVLNVGLLAAGAALSAAPPVVGGRAAADRREPGRGASAQ